MLRPRILIPADEADGLHEIDPGCLNYTPVEITTGMGIEIRAFHISPMREDHSIRVWVSKQPDGNPVVDEPPNIVAWTMGRVDMHRVLVHDWEGRPPVDTISAMPVPPGRYVVNFLNLANAVNAFSLNLVVKSLS